MLLAFASSLQRLRRRCKTQPCTRRFMLSRVDRSSSKMMVSKLDVDAKFSTSMMSVLLFVAKSLCKPRNSLAGSSTVLHPAGPPLTTQVHTPPAPRPRSRCQACVRPVSGSAFGPVRGTALHHECCRACCVMPVSGHDMHLVLTNAFSACRGRSTMGRHQLGHHPETPARRCRHRTVLP